MHNQTAILFFLQGEKDEIIKFCNPMLQFKGLHGALYRVYPTGQAKGVWAGEYTDWYASCQLCLRERRSKA